MSASSEDPAGTLPSSGVSTAVGTELLFENDRIRVWNMVLQPGEASARHRHEADYVYVYVTPSSITVEPAGAPATHGSYDDGYVQYREVGGGVEHRISNAGDAPHRQIIVELKGASRSSVPTRPQTNGRSRSP